MTPYEEIAVAFARALVAGDFERAHALLTPEQRKGLSPSVLRKQLHQMYEGYAAGPARNISHDPAFSMDEWPGKKPDDVGWTYVGIEGPDFVEAVAVVVQQAEGALLIRDVEWGRP